jgi:hypothetical protein
VGDASGVREFSAVFAVVGNCGDGRDESGLRVVDEPVGSVRPDETVTDECLVVIETRHRAAFVDAERLGEDAAGRVDYIERAASALQEALERWRPAVGGGGTVNANDVPVIVDP